MPLPAGLLLPLSVILLAGLLVLSSVSPDSFYRQIWFVALGIMFVFLFRKMDWQGILGYRWFILGLYALSVFFLALVLIIGPDIRNVKSWLVIGPFSFQPAELMKVSLILLYAEYFSRRHMSIARWKTIFTSFTFFVIPAVLTAAQPALGSAIVLFGIWFGFLISSGLPRDKIFMALGAFIVAAFFMWNW